MTPRRMLQWPFLALLASTGGAAVLSWAHTYGLDVAGCGAGSGCEEAARSSWGHLGPLDWPTAHLGLAYFLALTTAWLAGRAPWPTALRWVVRLGVLASLAFTARMLVEGTVCPWCLLVHGGNLAFLVAVERRRRASPPAAAGPRALPVFAATFAVGLTALALLEHRASEARRSRDERELAASIEELREGADPMASRPFTGRYRLGPSEAAIRIVAFSDYQCEDCRRIEAELRAVLAARDDVSFSAKHYPFCTDCNERARRLGKNLHPNACRAARAAEAAGIVGGGAGFWRMHRWLFEHAGAFTDSQLRAGAVELGLDPDGLLRELQGPETLARVRNDVAEAHGLGLHTTPMIFLNGVELKGWRSPSGLARAVESLAASAPPARGPGGDRPPTALQKFVADWRDGPRRALSTEPRHHWTGSPIPDRAAAEIVLWGDYQEPNCRELDGLVRAALADAPDARYSFRHYPIDQECNSSTPRTLHPGACTAARAAEAAATLGGDDAFWAVHAWLFERAGSFAPEDLAAFVLELGLDPAGHAALMDAPETRAVIELDAAEARRLRLRGVPFLFVAGRHVPRWRLEGHSVVAAILDQLD